MSIRDRYKRIVESKWFKDAYENRPLGETMEITDEQAEILENFNKKFIESQKPLDPDDYAILEEAIQAEFNRQNK